MHSYLKMYGHMSFAIRSGLEDGDGQAIGQDKMEEDGREPRPGIIAGQGGRRKKRIHEKKWSYFLCRSITKKQKKLINQFLRSRSKKCLLSQSKKPCRLYTCTREIPVYEKLIYHTIP